jgi:hypothetical protein
VRRSAQWALGLGAALVAMATAGAACADVVPIDVDECSTSCISSATDDAAAAEDALADDITLSLSGGGIDDANNVRPDLIFDSRALPPVLVSGLPSPIMSVGARALDDPGVSPYAFFEDVIDVPHFADARGFPAVPLFLFTPSLTSRLTDFLWASNDFFGPRSGDIASRRGLPLSADAESLTGRLTAGWKMRMPVTPTPSPSPVSAPPSSDAAEPFGQVGYEAGRSAELSSDGAESNK